MDQFWLHWNSLPGAIAAVDLLVATKVAIELMIIGYAVIWTWGRIRGTQAERLVKGMLVIASVYILSWVTGLTLITSILNQLIPVAVVSLVIIFQPELRRGLGYLGKRTFRIDVGLADTKEQRTNETIKFIIKAIAQLSRERIGALIVVEPPEAARDYISPGTTINGEVSSNLILSIFQPKSPLHDGAVVIRSDKIVAAGVILPITDNPKVKDKYGTRHRAAIGLSEIYDGLCIVVSEETGLISAANRGMLVQYASAEDLADPLSYYYHHGEAEAKAESPFQSFLSLFSSRKEAGQVRKVGTAAGGSLNNDSFNAAPDESATTPSLQVGGDEPAAFGSKD